MLYNVTIGDVKPTKKWALTSTTVNDITTNMMINEETFFQIKLGKNVTPKIDLVRDEQFEIGYIDTYEIPTRTFMSHNNKNLCPILMNFWSKDNEVLKNHVDDDVYVINVDSRRFKLITRSLYVGDIKQTFRRPKTNKFGCNIVVPEANYYGSEVVLDLLVYDFKDKKFKKVELLTPNENKCVRLNWTAIFNFKEIKNIYPREYTNKANYFEVTTFATDLGYTKCVIVDASEYDEFVESLASDIFNTLDIVTVKDGQFNDYVKKYIKDTRYKAFTTVGSVKVPKSLCKELGILYTFHCNLDGYFWCTKSY